MKTNSQNIRSASEHLGADIHGIDIKAMLEDASLVHVLKDALAEYGVLRFPAQKLDAGTVTLIAKKFGPLLNIKRVGNQAHHIADAEFIKVISNGRAADGRPIGDGNSSSQIWHSDATPWEVPPGFVLFYARQVPEVPPRTSWMDMRKVYQSLSEAMKRRIESLRVVHYQYNRYSGGIETRVLDDSNGEPFEERARGFVHPLVRRHLETGMPILYLPVRRDSLIIGKSDEESTELLSELWNITNAAPFHWSAAMLPDDVVIWDNRTLVHSREGWSDEETRIMWHMTLAGEAPTPMFPTATLNKATQAY